MKLPWVFLYFFLVVFNPKLWSPNAIAVSGNPGAMTINSAIAGQAPTNAVNTSTTYSVSVIGTKSIVGAINTNTQANVTLKVSLAAPLGATSAGLVTMSTTNQTLVSNVINATTISGLQINYTLSATASAAQVAGATRTVTFTLQ
jgi:hypothetical protein